MISASELRRGVVIELDGKLYQVLEYQHVKMKRTAVSRVKLRELSAGHSIERTFPTADKFVRVDLEPHRMQYLYNDGALYYFMDEATFEQRPLTTAQLGDMLNFLKEGNSIVVSIYNDEVVGVEMPVTVELAVAETEPGFKGDTATAGTKPARLETGHTIQVPLFINEGDVVKIDTRTGSYIERSG